MPMACSRWPLARLHPAQALDARLKDVIPPAVARAAVESGVARAPWPAHYPPSERLPLPFRSSRSPAARFHLAVIPEKVQDSL